MFISFLAIFHFLWSLLSTTNMCSCFSIYIIWSFTWSPNLSGFWSAPLSYHVILWFTSNQYSFGFCQCSFLYTYCSTNCLLFSRNMSVCPFFLSILHLSLIPLILSLILLILSPSPLILLFIHAKMLLNCLLLLILLPFCTSSHYCFYNFC